jgi:hypothetical protein
VTGLVPVLAALLIGWSVWRRLGDSRDPAAAVAASTVAGVAVTVAWMALLDVTGIRWSAGLLLAPIVPALALTVGARARPAPAEFDGGGRWAIAAAAVVAIRAAWIAAVPAFGWDFRYIWGLKARVLALAGSHDPAWLTWPGHGFAHPGYPPAWSDLIAAGVACGASAAASAAAWQALLVVALAAACWEIARPCPPRLRALAASATAWSPVLGDPQNSGYAEPLTALLAAVALGALAALGRGERAVAPLLAVACGVLAVTKGEGLALAVGVSVGAALVGGVRATLPAAVATAAAGGAWRLAIAAGVAPVDQSFAPSLAAALAHARALPAALAAAVQQNPVIAFMLAVWALVLASWRPAELRGVRLACGVWGLAVLGAYLSTTADLTWHLANSADRVLAVPLPAVLSLVLAARFTRADGRSAPASSRGGSPSG